MSTQRPQRIPQQRRQDRQEHGEVLVEAAQPAPALSQTLALLREPRAGIAVRSAGVLGLQRSVGNSQVQRTLDATATQHETSGGQTDAPSDENYDALVKQKLEEFLAHFSNIPVNVTWEKDGETKHEVVYVHPPYFMNVPDRNNARKRTLERFTAANKHRGGADSGTKEIIYDRSFAEARVGKSTPEDIQQILEQAIRAKKITGPGGKMPPDGDSLRDWLIKYGIGIDCSGFVSQALNAVMQDLHERAGLPTDGLPKLNEKSDRLKGGEALFNKIEHPADLRPGDTMHKEGHIRIVMEVTEGADGGIEFTTVESASDKGDIGPNRERWCYQNVTKLTGLKHWDGEAWTSYKPVVTFGRYKRLKQFQTEHPDLSP